MAAAPQPTPTIGHALYGRESQESISAVSGGIDTALRHYRYPSTQEMANLFPGYMNGRTNKYSYYQQLLNMFGRQIDEQKIALIRHLKNKFPQTFLLDTIDTVYTVPIPGESYARVFAESSTVDSIELFQSEHTDYERWWYDSPRPNARILPQNELPYTALTRSQIKNKFIPLSDFVQINYPTKLFFILHADSSVSFVKQLKDEDIQLTEIIIKGIDEFDKECEERLIYFYPTMRQTINVWKEIHSIDCIFWDSPDKIALTVSNFLPADLEYIEEPVYKYIDSDRNVKPMFWQYDNVLRKLRLITFSAATIMDKEGGVFGFDTVSEYKLKADSSGSDLTGGNIFLLPSINDDKLYLWNNSGLFFAYNKFDNVYPIAKTASKLQSQTPIVDISVEYDYVNSKLKITADFNRENNIKIKKYRFSTIDKTGARLNYINDMWTSEDLFNDYPFDHVGFASPIIEYNFLPAMQEQLILIEVIGSDGNKYTDTYIADSMEKYPLYYLTIQDDTTGDNELTSLDNNIFAIKNDSTFIKFMPELNTFMVDADNKRLITSIPQRVQFVDTTGTVIVSGYTTPATFNVFNELDQWGEVLSVKRLLGEKNYNYIKRLRESSAKPSNSTFSGVLYGMSRDLNQSVVDALKITDTIPYNLKIEYPYIEYGTSKLNLFNYTSDNIGADVTGTMHDIVSWFNFINTSISASIDILDDTAINMPIRFLVPMNNIENHLNEDWADNTYIKPHIDLNSTIIADSVHVDGFTRIEPLNSNAQGLFDTTEAPSFVTAFDGSYQAKFTDHIIANQKLNSYNRVSYQTIKKDNILKVSKIAIYSMPENAGNFAPGYMSDFVKDLLNYLDNQFPNKWVN